LGTVRVGGKKEGSKGKDGGLLTGPAEYKLEIWDDRSAEREKREGSKRYRKGARLKIERKRRITSE